MNNPYTIKAYDYLRRKILSGSLRPGAFLSAQSLSKEIGTSRTPVKEALRLLEYNELVTIAPKVGAVVKTLSREQFEDLLGYREALETYTAGKVATMRRSGEVDLLHSTLNRMVEPMNILLKNPAATKSLMLFGDCDSKFHHLLFSMARNTLVQRKFERAQILQHVLSAELIARTPADEDSIRDNVETVFQQHTAIFEAIRDGDAPAAQSAMSQHMRSFVAKATKRTEHSSIDQLFASPHELLI